MGRPKDQFEIVEKKGQTFIKIISGGGHKKDRAGSGKVYWAWKDDRGKIVYDHREKLSDVVTREIVPKMFAEAERKRLGL